MIGLAIGCGPSVETGSSPADPSAAAKAKNELRGYVEDVTTATASRYGARDDRGNEMDTVKIIAAPDGDGFVGLYHSYRDETFSVHLATSSDLINWTWRIQLATQASMPAIKPALDGGYVVAWEQEPRNHLKFAYYASWTDLLDGNSGKTFEAPWTLSPCAEGTPNLYEASGTFVDAGFHFYDDCDLDRQARGSTNWASWSASTRPTLEEAVRANGVEGGVGDRDVIGFDGYDFTLIEGQVVRDDWRTWRVFLHDDVSGEATQLDFRTDAGSVAFTNPTIAQIEIGGQRALLVSLFVPQEGAKGGEEGELIFYRIE